MPWIKLRLSPPFILPIKTLILNEVQQISSLPVSRNHLRLGNWECIIRILTVSYVRADVKLPANNVFWDKDPGSTIISKNHHIQNRISQTLNPPQLSRWYQDPTKLVLSVCHPSLAESDQLCNIFTRHTSKARSPAYNTASEYNWRMMTFARLFLAFSTVFHLLISSCNPLLNVARAAPARVFDSSFKAVSAAAGGGHHKCHRWEVSWVGIQTVVLLSSTPPNDAMTFLKPPHEG